MAYSYLLIPHMVVQDANAQPTALIVGAPAPTAYLGFAHNLALKIGAKRHDGVAIIHHDLQFLGDVDGSTLNMHQYRAASFIDKSDYAGAGITPVLSGQPTARCNMEVSVVVRFDAAQDFNPNMVEDFLRGGRLAGGAIVDHRFDADTETCNLAWQTDTRALCHAVGAGMALHDRVDLLVQGSEDADLLDTLLRVTAFKGTETETKERAWVQPTSVGYAQITLPTSRANAREFLEHAFAESLIGLVQYRSVRSSGIPFWQYTHPVPGVFLASASQPQV